MAKATRIGRSGVAGAAVALLFGWLRQGHGRKPKRKPQQDASNPDTMFETRDTPPGLFPVLGGLAASLIVTVVVSLLLIFPEAAEDENHALATPMPEPRLQTDPVADLKRYKAQAMERLTGYGWADRAHGIAHIPIEEAMRRVAERGIADWPADARREAQR